MPVPLLGEYLAYCTKTAQALGTLFGKYITEITHITFQSIPAIFDTGRNRTPETVFNIYRLIFISIMHDTYPEIIIGSNLQGIPTHSGTSNHHIQFSAYVCILCTCTQIRDDCLERCPCSCIHTVHSKYCITCHKAG